jgi:serralysin
MLPAPSELDIVNQLSALGSWYKPSISYTWVSAWTEALHMDMAPENFDLDDVVELSTSQQSAFGFAAELWDDLIAAKIEQSLGTDAADITIVRYDQLLNTKFETRWSSDTDAVPFAELKDVYVWMDFSTETIFENTIDYRAILHEMGHALGLFHAGDYNVSADPLDASSSQDTTLYSVMSYFGPDRLDAVGFVESANWVAENGQIYMPQTPMMNDILALQAMYGADESTRCGDTTYGYNVADIVGRERIYDFTGNLYPVLCIYDADGNDTLDLSGWATDSKISLIPGTFSDANGMTKNISIARNTVIENAVGGSGNDDIVGNTDDNILVGGRGNDVLNGGPSLSPASGIDTVDYSARWTANFGMTAALVVDMTKTAGQVLNDGFGNQDTLIGIEKIVGSARSDYFNIAGNLRIVDGGDDDYDEVSFASSGEAVNINLNEVAQRGGLAEGIELYNIEGVTGSTKNDVIRLRDIGQTFASAYKGHDTIYGGHGNAVVRGGDGNDTYYHVGGTAFFDGGNDYNTLDLSMAGGGFNIDFIAGTADSAFSQLDFDKVQRIVGSNVSDTFLFGNGILSYKFGQNIVYFNGGQSSTSIDALDFSNNTIGVQLYYHAADTLKTSDGLKHFASFEKFIGGSGNDTFTFLNGMKEAHGGDGTGVDTLDITRWSSTNVIHYWATSTWEFEGGSISMTGWENIVSRAGQIGIVGTDGNDTFHGSPGPDRLWGGNGDDTFLFSAGDDQLFGGDNDDTFYVSLGDKVDGGAGYDRVYVQNVGQFYSVANFKEIEEFNFASTTSNAQVTFTSKPMLKIVFEGTGIQDIGFTDASGYKDVDLGDWDDTVRARGEGHYNGGHGSGDVIDFTDMIPLGLTIDKESGTVTWGEDESLTFEQFETVRYILNGGITVFGDESGEYFAGARNIWAQDVFDGRGGDDVLRATGGNDILIGGAGADTFIFTERNSTTVVKDFERGTDKLSVSFYGDHWQKVVDDDVYLMNTIGGQATAYAILENAGIGHVDLGFVYL